MATPASNAAPTPSSSPSSPAPAAGQQQPSVPSGNPAAVPSEQQQQQQGQAPPAISPQDFRALTEKYEQLKQMEKEYQAYLTQQREAQKPIMEKTILNLARITNKLDPADKQAPIKFTPEVQTFLTNQFLDLKNKDMANLFTTISDRFEEAGSKYEALQAQATGYQQQIAELQKQNMEFKSLLEKQTVVAEQQQRARAADVSSNTEPQVPNLMSDMFQRMVESSPIDSLFGNNRAANNKRTFEKMNNIPAAQLQSNLKEVSQEASRDAPTSQQSEEPPAKRARVEIPEGVAPSHARLFSSLAGIKHQVNMRDPNRYLPDSLANAQRF